MVGPGEVDEELEAETAEECSKYGKVLKCLIFEVSLMSVDLKFIESAWAQPLGGRLVRTPKIWTDPPTFYVAF